MKYENIKIVNDISSKIRDKNTLLNELDNHTDLRIEICIQTNRVQSIGLWETSDHAFRKQGIEMVENIRTELKKEIEELHKQLADL